MKNVIFVSLLLLSLLAVQEIHAGEADDMTAGELIDRGDSVFNSGQYEKSREYFLKAAEQAQVEKSKSALTEANAMIARTYLILDDPDQGREYLARAVENASVKEPLGWSRYLGVRGRFEWNQGQLEKATNTFIEMYHYCLAQELYGRAVDAAHMVAITGSEKDQIEWGLKGIEDAKRFGTERWLGPLWNNLGWSYEDQGKYSKSLDAYLNAREFHYKYGSERQKLVADWAVGHAQRLAGDLKAAKKTIKPLVKKFKKIDDSEFLGWTYKELGEIAFAKGEYKDAVENLRQAVHLLKKAGMIKWDNKGYYEIVDLFEEAKIKADEHN